MPKQTMSEMKKYIGTKIIFAMPMTKEEYCDYRGWLVPGDEDPNEEVYLVEYEADENSKPNHPEHAGYISMSPKHVFEKAYRETTGLTFGQAIEAAKLGKPICRKGWNGAGMFAYIVPGAFYPAQTGVAKDYFGEKAMVPYREYWALKTAQGDVSTWAPSGSDSLADDWEIFKEIIN